MFSYYLKLGLRSLKRNPLLTALMIFAISFGIGASMTTLTVLRAMSGNPIPEKSSVLFVPQIDNRSPQGRGDNLQPPDRLTYQDAMFLLRSAPAAEQVMMYATSYMLNPEDRDLRRYEISARAAGRNFFSMFDVPFKYGGSWDKSSDEGGANVVVLTHAMNKRLFNGENSVGRYVTLDTERYRVVGVMDDWSPVPRFYDVTSSIFANPEDVFVPVTKALSARKEPAATVRCFDGADPGWDGRLHSECIWIQFWAQLNSADEASRYRTFLSNYASHERDRGRFQWPANIRLRDVMSFMDYENVVPDSAKMLVIVSFSFLVVCMINVVCLMFAKFAGRGAEITVRRALGAKRRAIFSQYLVETAVVGLAGGVIGIGMLLLGLAGMRTIFSSEINRLTRLDLTGVILSLIVSIGVTIIAGVYPAWRAMRTSMNIKVS